MRRLALLVFLLVYSGVSAARSPSCPPPASDAVRPWAETQLESADLVFSGRVHRVLFVGARNAPDAKGRNVTSMKELLELIERQSATTEYDHLVTFRLETVWKGTLADKFITLRVRLGEVPRNPMRLAERYVVAANRLENDELYIVLPCRDAVRQDRTRALIEALDQMTATP